MNRYGKVFMLAGLATYLYGYRYLPAKVARRVNESGRAYLTPSLLDGKQVIRVSVGAERTERRHVEALWRLMREEACR